jgi:hypothetical protein
MLAVAKSSPKLFISLIDAPARAHSLPQHVIASIPRFNIRAESSAQTP